MFSSQGVNTGSSTIEKFMEDYSRGLWRAEKTVKIVGGASTM